MEWTQIELQSPFYLFIPQNIDCKAEYEQGWKITDIMPVNSTGVKTHRDHFVFDFDSSALYERIKDFRNLNLSDEEISENYSLSDTGNWRLSENRRSLAADSQWENYFAQCLYRPFDVQFYYCHQDVVDRPRHEVMRHMLAGNNLAFATPRQTKEEWDIKASELIIDHKSLTAYDTNSLFPLYLYPDMESDQGSLLMDKTPNLSSGFLNVIREKLDYIPTPEAIFYYIYAVFHSPTYRQRYAEFLKIDFPRVPLTSNDQLFQTLGEKGQTLVELHLMKSKKLNKVITKFPVSGDNAVTEVTYKAAEQQVYINKIQYFAGIVPEVWAFKIGGYQVLDKWLKDRKKAKRSLSFDDVLHYQRVVVALKETMQVMDEIDQLIPSWPLE